ncbi:MAG: OmcA/MtrC family decaheme c-type cytochrome [bacterium]|nr:OmcA/MtrC family decaheme c-type cytochrome [bacterium]
MGQRTWSSLVLGAGLVVAAASSWAATLVPGGGAARQDCLVQLAADGVGFPAGKTPKGVTCADGDSCDLDGQRNGVCLLSVALCLNQATRSCQPGQVTRVTLKTKKKSPIDVSGLQAAVDAVLPAAGPACAAAIALPVPLGGPNKRGIVPPTEVLVKAVAKAGGRTDRSKFKLTCVPTTVAGVTVTTTSTTVVAPTTTTTTTIGPIPPGPPGAGLTAAITAAAVAGAGTVTVTFRLGDGAGVPVTPVLGATTNPAQARVRFTIARLDVVNQTVEGFTTDFTRYRSYVVPSPGQPGYDAGGTLALVDAATGVYTYTFATTLPAGFPATATHTVGAQVERSYAGATLVANPLLDFVPSGAPVTVVRQVTTTAQCNGCHDPLALHGGARREVGLCQLCHTDQGFDPESGNSIELQQMVHRIHQGKDLPSIVGGPVGSVYEIIGFQNQPIVFAEKVLACTGGALAGVPCASDADCPDGTCTGATATGVGFPQDTRNCAVCHADGATHETYATRPSTSACTGCHDDVNPGETTTEAGPPGTNHVAGAQPDTLCRLCHTPSGTEFDISVTGAHTIPARSATLAGLAGELLSASGAAGGAVIVTFRLRNGAGTPLTTLTGLNRVALALSGPTTDFGGATPHVTTPTIFGGGASGTLTGPDGSGVFTYTTTVGNGVPAGATGSWRVGLEARRSVTVHGQSVNEAMQNVVLDFPIDGSPLVPRRTVVAQEKCGSCHGVFSVDFSIHGGLRNQTDYCVVCHNPNMTDFARRVTVSGADPRNQPIDLKHMLHKIHTGDDLTQIPYVIYGFGPAAIDFAEVRFPGNRADCEQCHVSGSYLLPLPAGVLPTVISEIAGSSENVVGVTPPIQDACLSCHDTGDAALHAQLNTTVDGREACGACHGEGAAFAVSVVHAAASP